MGRQYEHMDKILPPWDNPRCLPKGFLEWTPDRKEEFYNRRCEWCAFYSPLKMMMETPMLVNYDYKPNLDRYWCVECNTFGKQRYPKN